ncbi:MULTISPECIES: BMC domain-containing protein [Clostridium]|uniref:Propanediol utilization protein PduA n=2 Tax=Clostridium TaxID=1485 RepID=A0A151API3_9CLOT|nr:MULTISPECIES: BMC domain-containing protein [Clostridium]KYH29503.1 propanediol utilization protein PduA [Clostridium colicanis DSM 13634]PRR70738.1 Propanediol utilization protein PduA [Clostridium thermopalmarium DSM 5974]PVZ22580.1 microcompartment protein CcmL/EutN [Clostridium thermopalmarium DSM 5974]
MEAVGFIEVRGKLPAIEAADICLKSANVKLIGCELTKGALVTVKIEGDVGAVKSAIDAAKVSDIVKSKLIASLVIPRPAKGISSMLQFDKDKEKEFVEETKDIEGRKEVIDISDAKKNEKPESVKEATCNLCHDSKCGRKRGQPKVLCIHFNKKVENSEGDISYETR